MKPKTSEINRQSGFTLIELLAVIAITLLLTGAVVINFASQREGRSLMIARNETITNLRKVQAYTLSSRTLPSGQGAKYYTATFSTGAEYYDIEAIDNNYNVVLVERVQLPGDVSIHSISSGTCVRIIFSAPFGTAYAHNASSCGSSVALLLQDPIQVANLSQGAVTIGLQTARASSSVKSFQISPLTGQIVPL